MSTTITHNRIQPAQAVSQHAPCLGTHCGQRPGREPTGGGTQGAGPGADHHGDPGLLQSAGQRPQEELSVLRQKGWVCLKNAGDTPQDSTGLQRLSQASPGALWDHSNIKQTMAATIHWARSGFEAHAAVMSDHGTGQGREEAALAGVSQPPAEEQGGLWGIGRC